MEIVFKKIGYIETPHTNRKKAPIQPGFTEVQGIVHLDPEYQQGLKDLEGFSHIILLYYFHKAKESALLIKPYLEDELKGVFATRYNSRPNNIGLSIVELLRIEDDKLFVKNIDVLNNTPLLDIKPLVPKFDLKNIENVRTGWLEQF